jgi:ribosomal-protein-serine acetyltransferase
MKNINPILIDLPIPIETPRLLMRPPKIGDGAMLNAAVLESFDLLNKFMLWANEKPSLEESEEIVRREAANWIFKKKEDPELMLLILDRKTNDFIGATGFHDINWDIPCVETGYWIRKKYSGQGLITEATNAITQYAFKALNVKRITITCDIDNEQSKKIPERLGYQLESIMRLNRVKPATGEITDTLVYVRFGLDDLPELEVTWGANG